MPRARNPEEIVPANNLLNVQTVLLENWNLIRLITALSDNISSIQWLATRRMLKNSVQCATCNDPCTLNRYSQGMDGFRWRCNECNYTLCVRDDSFFSQSHLTLQKLVLLVYFWALQTPQKDIKRELDVTQDHTTVDWFNFIRDAKKN